MCVCVCVCVCVWGGVLYVVGYGVATDVASSVALQRSQQRRPSAEEYIIIPIWRPGRHELPVES